MNQRPTKEELDRDRAETDAFMERYTLARNGIIAELKRRWDAKDPQVKLVRRSDDVYDEERPTDYIAGVGQMDCPVCKAGKLSYSRAAYNGHIHAGCSTAGCVRWME